MEKIEEMLLEHRKKDSFRNNLIHELELHANTLTHTTIGSTIDSTAFETLKFVDFDTQSDVYSPYATARSFSSPEVSTLNKSPQVIFKKEISVAPNYNMSRLDNPSAISLLQKNNATFMEEEEDADTDTEEGLLTSTSMSRMSAKITERGTKAFKEIQSIVKRSSSMRLKNSIEDLWLNSLKSMSPKSSGDESIEEPILRTDQLVDPSTYKNPDKEISTNGKESEHKRRKVQTLWGVTRISIYDDRSSTFEIFGKSTQKPNIECDKLEGIFVIGPQ